MTQQQLADACRLDIGYVGQVERGAEKSHFGRDAFDCEDIEDEGCGLTQECKALSLAPADRFG
jgi:hypothetical protein